MPNEQEDRWRGEFEQWGYDAVRRTVFGTSGWDEPRRQFAFRWLREKEGATERRKQQMQQDTRRSLWVAVVAMVVAALSLCISIIALVR